MIIHGDCLEKLKAMDENSVDSVVTDPPYGWRFMGKAWDAFDIEKKRIAELNRPPRKDGKSRGRGDPSLCAGSNDQSLSGNRNFQKFTEEWAREAFRILKPGGHMLVFCGPRTYHRMASGLEDAGFEIRDQLQWNFGSGFPKSLDIRKSAIKQGIACACETSDEKECCPDASDLPGLSEDLAAEKSLSSCQKQDLLAPLQENLAVKAEDRQRSAIDTDNLDKMCCVFESGGQKECVVEANQSCDMQSSLQREIASQESHSVQWKHEGSQGNSAVWCEESSLEGRSDIQAHQGQLHRSEVCEMPDRMDSDGAQGRLHNGASSDHGNTYESPADSDGSGSSQGSQHEEQSSFQPGIFPDKLSAQTCRSCGKPRLAGGIGTALKPANEPICLARKPISEKTVAANVLKHGTGGLNIDASRVGTEQVESGRAGRGECESEAFGKKLMSTEKQFSTGRWPANLILDEEAAAMLDEQSGVLKSGSIKKAQYKEGLKNEIYGKFGGFELKEDLQANSGGASRFFYVAKASKKERNAGCEGMPERLSTKQFNTGMPNTGCNADNSIRKNAPIMNQNHHPTVKPVKLMEYLIRLITPPNGTVLDPFMGSGSTGVAAKNLGFQFIGIEMNEEYVAIADRRIG